MATTGSTGNNRETSEAAGSTAAGSSSGFDRDRTEVVTNREVVHDSGVSDAEYERGLQRGREEGRRDASASDDGSEERRKEAYGGLNIGASFFGWLVAIALTILLTGILSAIAGASYDNLNLTPSDAKSSAGTVALTTGIALLVVLMIGYFAGGYVAGRMSRFDGVKQGIGVWVIGLVVTILVAIIGAVAGANYNIFKYVPSIPIPTDTMSTSGIIALVAVLLGTLLAAILGGKIGQRYHTKVDRVS